MKIRLLANTFYRGRTYPVGSVIRVDPNDGVELIRLGLGVESDEDPREADWPASPPAPKVRAKPEPEQLRALPEHLQGMGPAARYVPPPAVMTIDESMRQ